jgi:hypothetical protein
MNTEQYVKELRNLTPNKNIYENRGFSDAYINEVIESFDCKKERNIQTYDNPLLELVENYEASKIQIGMIYFSDSVEVANEYYIIGKVESDPLVVEKSTGVVKVLEYGVNHEMWECAESGSKFLDALIELGKFIVATEADNYNDACVAANNCSLLAGGELYVDFYKMLLGCWQ